MLKSKICADLCFTSLVLVSFIYLVVSEEDCTVTIKNGTIIGRTADTADSTKKICSYTAIPFAAPPVGPLRFKVDSLSIFINFILYFS